MTAEEARIARSDYLDYLVKRIMLLEDIYNLKEELQGMYNNVGINSGLSL